MKQRILGWLNTAFLWSGPAAMTLFLLLVLFGMYGCAVGRGPAGEVVLGFEAGKLADTGNAVLGQVGEAIFGDGGGLLGAGVAALGGVGGVGIWLRSRFTQAEKRRREADQAREEAQREAAVISARMEVASANVA